MISSIVMIRDVIGLQRRLKGWLGYPRIYLLIERLNPDILLLHSFHLLAEIMDEIDRTEKTNDKLEKENEMLHVYENNL